uniref:PPM-type phosphatase domain-containing protein n=1 Tax=Arcella intermedia TaxID=1963864 RepID=A0A6B2KXS9_9EUKA
MLCEFHNTHNVPLFDIKAPQTDKEPTEVGVTGLIEGKSITNYPSDPGMEGFALNCDVMRATHVGNRMVAVVADGCGWGKHARKASEEGSKAVVEYLTKDPATQEKIVDTETCSQELVSSFVYAHEAVVNNQFYPDRRRVGLTTLIAGMTLKLKNQFGTDEEWAFVCASVGDCKAYHWNAKNGKVTDICVGNRNNPHDPKDCGGCIGPFKKDQPDFRNLGTYFQPCRTGDIIMLMSDGVHDNLDPENFGLLPNELEENLNRDWKDWFAAGQKDVEKLKSDFSCKKLEELLAKVKNPTPQDVSALLIKHCLSMTQAKRKLMETTPAGEPVASKEYPGKMDHATILAFVVSDLVVGEEKMKSSAKKEKKRYKPFWKKEFVRNGSSSAGNPFENKINDILPTIPRVFVIPWDMNNSQKFKRSQFSDQECLQNDSGDFFGWAISTFPNMGTKEYPKRIADPITNFFQASLSPGRHCFVLTSGVGYGQEYMTSSSMAASEFNLYMDKAQAKISDTQTAATTLLKALNHAHNKIINIDEHTNETAVTLIGVSAFRLPSLEEEDEQTNTSPSQWAVLCVNVGDHRLFYWNVANQKLTELTKSVSSETDAFHDEVGRIGSIPDLRNLGVYVQFCSDEEDIVIAVSSLVYWNYDPQNLGQPMKEEYKKKWKKWERVPMEVRQEEIMGNIERRLRARSAEVSTGKKLTQLFSEEFKKNTKDVTKPKRQLLKLMENENNKAYNKLYGKMGHATCVVLRVGDFIASKTVPLLPPELKMDLIQRNERKKLLKQSAFQKFVPTAKKPSIDIED